MFFKRVFTVRNSVLAVSLICFFSALVIIDELEDTVDISQSKNIDKKPLVSVIDVLNQSQNLSIEAYSEVYPEWNLDLKTEVGGKITYIHPKTQIGSKVSKGQTLFTIDNTEYLYDLAESEHALSQSLLELKRTKYESYVAKSQFKSAGKNPPNELAILLPQIEIAKSALKAAKSRVAVTKRKLALTTVKAPFSGFLINSDINLGQTIVAGESVAKLVSHGKYKLSVKLNKKQWKKLKHPLNGQSANLFDDEGKLVGSATVQQSGGYLDTSTRHYSVQLVATEKEANIVTGDYIRVVFSGLSIKNALHIPATALTLNGNIWWVDENNLLQRSSVELLDRDDQRVIIKAPNTVKKRWRILITPLSSYLPGQKVSLKFADNKIALANRGGN